MTTLIILILMAYHGERAEKMGHAGREYWSRRPGQKMGVWGRVSKWFTHRAERRQAKREARRELDEIRRSPIGGYDL